MKGIFYILLAYLLGELVSTLTGGYLPGSVIGMIILFVSLRMRIIKSVDVEKISSLLLNNMLLFFVPIGVGLMVAYKALGVHLISIMLTIIFSTLIVLVIVGWLQQKQNKKRK